MLIIVTKYLNEEKKKEDKQEVFGPQTEWKKRITVFIVHHANNIY